MSKTMWILLSLTIAITILFMIYSFTSRNIETPSYTVIRTIQNVEIRNYPKLVIAKTSLNNASFDQSGSTGFRTIASYIFGGNESQQKIAMTAPVVMSLGDSSTMYFVMPKQYRIEELPRPNQPNLSIAEESAKTMAVLSFGGFSNDSKIKKHCDELENILTENNIRTKGQYVYMGYNAPWDVVGRRNEVAVEVILE